LAAPEFIADYTTLFPRKWLNTATEDVGYPDEFPARLLEGRAGAAKL
jgi:hypothetical protein